MVPATCNAYTYVAMQVLAACGEQCFTVDDDDIITLETKHMNSLSYGVLALVQTSTALKQHYNKGMLSVDNSADVGVVETVMYNSLQLSLASLRKSGGLDVTEVVSGNATVHGAVTNNVTVTAQLTVPTLADTEQPAEEMTAMIGSFTVANIRVVNVYNRVVAVQLADDLSADRTQSLFTLHTPTLPKLGNTLREHDDAELMLRIKDIVVHSAVLQPGESAVLGPVYYVPQHCCECNYTQQQSGGVFLRNNMTLL
eukprot:15245-Heterococcus_DN1.PRE.3